MFDGRLSLSEQHIRCSVKHLQKLEARRAQSENPRCLHYQAIETIGSQRLFVLKFLQARIPTWTERVFFADFDPHATWIDELKPGFGDKEFFFEEGYRKIAQRKKEGSSGQLEW